MKKSQLRHSILTGVFTIIFSLFVASLFFHETGELSLFKEIAATLFALACAALGVSVAISLFKTNRLGAAFIVLIFAGTLLCFGSEQTVNITKDVISGQQVLLLEKCSIDESDKAAIISSRYELKGYTPTGSLRTFPLSGNEYRSLFREMDTPEDTWNIKITGYLNCDRIITFTAEKDTTEIGEGAK